LHDLLVEDSNASSGNSTHREFLKSRDSELSDQKYVEGDVQRDGDFICDGNTSARQRENQHIRVIGVREEF
jgi:hypothetical protein